MLGKTVELIVAYLGWQSALQATRPAHRKKVAGTGKQSESIVRFAGEQPRAIGGVERRDAGSGGELQERVAGAGAVRWRRGDV